MIHRDLKPVNIFIDAGDHIKIGDFGLATTSEGIAGGGRADIAASADVSLINDSLNAQEDLTGQIGTALYIAPEVNIGRVTSYTQKVDIYSLGVIFFEMCNPALTTGMERVKVLTALRSKHVELPPDSEERLSMQQIYLIKWMLSHDAGKRPNSQELLTSDYLPPPQVEEAEMRELVRHTLANDKSAAYRHLVDACLAQEMSLAQDISYDAELTRELARPVAGSKRTLSKTLAAQERIRQAVEAVFRRHGAVHCQESILTPRGKANRAPGGDPKGAVEVMTRGGRVVRLSYDPRVAFARFVARAKVSDLRRYSLSPVRPD